MFAVLEAAKKMTGLGIVKEPTVVPGKEQPMEVVDPIENPQPMEAVNPEVFIPLGLDALDNLLKEKAGKGKPGTKLPWGTDGTALF